MEMPVGSPDRVQLSEFVTQLRQVFVQLLERRQALLPEQLQELAMAAWDETEDALRRLRTQLDDPEDAEELDRALRSVGLTGASLAFKLGGFRLALRRPQPQDVRRFPRWLRPVLRWANVVLGSLSKVLPIAEPIKEYKESFEAGLEDVRD